MKQAKKGSALNSIQNWCIIFHSVDSSFTMYFSHLDTFPTFVIFDSDPLGSTSSWHWFSSKGCISSIFSPLRWFNCWAFFCSITSSINIFDRLIFTTHFTLPLKIGFLYYVYIEGFTRKTTQNLEFLRHFEGKLTSSLLDPSFDWKIYINS